MNTTKQVALITGASAGIGATYADRLARRGYALVLVARDTQRLEALATRLQDETGTSIEVLPADLTRDADVAKVEQRVQAGDVTLLINNAGMSLKGGLLENGPAALEQIIALNVAAPTRLAAAAATSFVERGSGAIINLSSVTGLRPGGCFEGVYSGDQSLSAQSQPGHGPRNSGRAAFMCKPSCRVPREPSYGEKAGRDMNDFRPAS